MAEKDNLIELIVIGLILFRCDLMITLLIPKQTAPAIAANSP